MPSCSQSGAAAYRRRGSLVGGVQKHRRRRLCRPQLCRAGGAAAHAAAGDRTTAAAPRIASGWADRVIGPGAVVTCGLHRTGGGRCRVPWPGSAAPAR
ncbi:hypothetical protein J7E87_34425 [Streptomyces sp. ISL-1]|nr:hypothetical protein [Streptomyces sp. ISL-1]